MTYDVKRMAAQQAIVAGVADDGDMSSGGEETRSNILMTLCVNEENQSSSADQWREAKMMTKKHENGIDPGEAAISDNRKINLLTTSNIADNRQCWRL